MSVLAFPKRNRGRVRKSNHVRSMGETAMCLLRNRGEPIPANVQPLFPPPPVRQSDTPEQALLLALFAALSDEQRRACRVALKAMSLCGDRQATRATEMMGG